ncbi:MULTISPECIES: nucleotide exchange factor GrpE [Methylobacillus]|uniref:Protein GrpE n=1 Tax=Methylobacillus flagellatus (strain ATCC 51484 / DSM 6875 / VKM B-1610 / KT) TaxID=265072 RepID=GRPE_METFK|nr:MULTISPECIES: nucleotide exchange factor GrpE [Methylobacillus]Q1H3B7.1 RecName: Full=Protein GrpE; AltName: Full=HSP-70 cofactor [Methylobacillus flagellatus KT]ABE49020.1 GrpE protein [Methylobacillus flagellatus KT]MPS49680.1 nucleotide exchange factor GrpE [Methylobacillus sp.]
MQHEDKTPEQQENKTPETELQQENAPATPQEAGAAGSIDDRIAELEAKLAEQQAAVLYAKAEGENIRRRAAEDIEKARKFALEKFSSELLAVKDSLDAALNVGSATLESYRDGVELTAKQLTAVFEKFSIVEINPVGEKFDPNKHQAIGTVESEAESNTVVNVLQKGYTLNDRVLRPALVMVAK